MVSEYGKPKYIDIPYEILKNLALRNNVKIIDINLENNLTDFFANPIIQTLFENVLDLFRIKMIPAHGQEEY